MRDGRRGIRIYSLLILVAGCALLSAVGVDLYRARDPVRRWIRESSPGNRLMTRVHAVLNLGHRVPPARLDEVFPILLAAAKDPDPAVRAVAAAALSWRKDRFAEVYPVLLVLMKDPVPNVRKARSTNCPGSSRPARRRRRPSSRISSPHSMIPTARSG